MLNNGAYLFPARCKHFFCLAVIFLLLFAQNPLQASDRLLFLEKAAESEKEENKSEEEQLELQENLNYSVQKSKKGKNIFLDSFLTSIFPKTFLEFSFAYCFHYLAYSEQSPFLFVSTPRYLFFGSLLFYEG
jgi:hypothetical protein